MRPENSAIDELLPPDPHAGRVEPRPIGNIAARSIPSTLPRHIAAMLAEPPIQGRRSDQAYALVAAAVEWGYSDPEVAALALQHAPTVDKYASHTGKEVARTLGKLRPQHQHEGSPCDRADPVCPHKPARWTGDTRPPSVTTIGLVPNGAAGGQVASLEPNAPPTADSGGRHASDLGNARRLVGRHGADLRYCTPRGRWLVWDGRRWADDATDEVKRRAKDTVAGIYAEAAALDAADERKALAKWALASEARARIDAILALAESELGVPVLPSALDADPWALNVLNGTLDLRTGKLRPHRREDLITRLAPVEYDPDATLPLWDDFLAKVTGGDAELERFLQRGTGYTLTGVTVEEKFFFAHGPAASGKSTFLEAVYGMLGDYAATADFESFLARREVGGVRPDIARLAGKRYVKSIEVDDGKRLAEGLIKNLTGGDTVTARFLYEREFEFAPAFKLWLSANDRPKVRDDDAALWRRILTVPFNNAIPDGERDASVKATLRDPEKAGAAVLAWAVRGCLDWQRQGLAVPAAVTRATDAYRADMDPIAGFLEDVCVVHAGARVATKALGDAYAEWARNEGMKKPLGPRQLVDRLIRAGTAERDRTKGARILLGVGLHDSPSTGEASPVTEVTGRNQNAKSLHESASRGGLLAKSVPQSPTSPVASTSLNAAELPCVVCGRPTEQRDGVQPRHTDGCWGSLS